MAAHIAFERAFENPDALVWWVGPTYKHSDIGFELLEKIIPPAFIEGEPKLSKPQEFKLVNGSRIQFRSADRKDGLVGVGLDLLIIDEAAMVPERAWKKELRPTLSDTLGDMIAISTPNGRNWFHDYYQRGQSDDYPEIESWSSSTYENKYVDDDEVDAAREEIPERIFRQEYLAEFLDDSGGVFEQVRERVVEDYDWEETDGEPPYTIGVDFARHQDWTVVTVLDTDGRLVDWRRVRDVSWPQIQSLVERMYDKYPGQTQVDASRDNKIVADLEDAGVDVNPITFSTQMKRALVEDLAAYIEAEELTLPDIPQLVSELEMFEYDVTSAGNVRYHAPSGFHDDCVDSLALALHGRRGRPVRHETRRRRGGTRGRRQFRHSS